MEPLRKALGWAALLGAGLLSVACAAQRSSESESTAPATASPPPAPASVPGLPGSTQEGSADLDQAEPATLAEAEAWLEKARADLDRLALNDVPPPASAAGGAPRAEAAPKPAPAPREQKRAADKAEEPAAAAQAAEKEASNPCETACKAFSSLTRASDAVCRLDSEGGQRCQRARQIQTDASRRVASCGCAK
jgi:hypothetical protein